MELARLGEDMAKAVVERLEWLEVQALTSGHCSR